MYELFFVYDTPADDEWESIKSDMEAISEILDQYDTTSYVGVEFIHIHRPCGTDIYSRHQAEMHDFHVSVKPGKKVCVYRYDRDGFHVAYPLDEFKETVIAEIGQTAFDEMVSMWPTVRRKLEAEAKKSR